MVILMYWKKMMMNKQFLKDHDYLFCNRSKFSNFSLECIIYIAGFLVHKVNNKVKCNICISTLLGSKENLCNSFVNFKDIGGLIYPSDDVISICIETDKYIKQFYKHSKMNKLLI